MDVDDKFLIDSSDQGKKLGTLKSLKIARNHLFEFLEKKHLSVNDFTNAVYNSFVAWMMSHALNISLIISAVKPKISSLFFIVFKNMVVFYRLTIDK